MDAAQCVVSGLKVEQDDLVNTIQNANDTLRKMDELNKFLGISADMIAIASAIYAAQPAVILAAVNALKGDIGGYKIPPKRRLNHLRQGINNPIFEEM